jgi:hypothetical protein
MGKFIKGKTQKPLEPINSVSNKIFDTHPFRLLTSKENREYARDLVRECGVTEKAIRKILIDTLETDSIILEIFGKHHEVSEQGEILFKGYTKAIEALEKAAGGRAIVNDKSFSACRPGRANISLREALIDDIEDLKAKRAKWASLFLVHHELKAEPIPRTFRRMIENQAFCIFLYIQKSIKKAGLKTENNDIYMLISDLFMALYDHPLFNATEKFTPGKIKEYCDNGKRDRRMKKTNLRKYLGSLQCVKNIKI